VGAEAPLALAPESALEDRAEDRRLDARPIEDRGGPKIRDLVRQQMDAGRFLEQPAVDVWRSRIRTVSGPRPRLREHLEQPPEVIGGRTARILHKSVEELREHPSGEQPKVLGKHAPNALEDKIAKRVRRRLLPLHNAAVDVGDERHGLASQLVTRL